MCHHQRETRIQQGRGKRGKRRSEERQTPSERSCVPRPPTRHSASRRPDLQHVTVEVQTSPVRILRATRRLLRDVSARSVGRSTSMCSTLRTVVRPTARSVPLGKCLSRWAARPEHVLVQTALAPSFSQRVPAEHVLSQTALSPTLSQWDPALVFSSLSPLPNSPQNLVCLTFSRRPLLG